MAEGTEGIEVARLYEGTKSFWRDCTSITIVLLEHRYPAVDTKKGKRVAPPPSFIEVIAFEPATCLEAPHLYVSSDALYAELNNIRADSDGLYAEKKTKSLRNLSMEGTQFVTDLKVKYLFDRVVIKKPSPSSVLPSSEGFSIEFKSSAGDVLQGNGMLQVQIPAPDVHGVRPVMEHTKLRRDLHETPKKISDWDSKLLEMAESAAKLKASYCSARKHSIACMRSLSSLGSTGGTGAKGEKDSRFGSVEDSQEQHSSSHNEEQKEQAALRFEASLIMALSKDGLFDKCHIDGDSQTPLTNFMTPNSKPSTPSLSTGASTPLGNPPSLASQSSICLSLSPCLSTQLPKLSSLSAAAIRDELERRCSRDSVNDMDLVQQALLNVDHLQSSAVCLPRLESSKEKMDNEKKEEKEGDIPLDAPKKKRGRSSTYPNPPRIRGTFARSSLPTLKLGPFAVLGRASVAK